MTQPASGDSGAAWRRPALIVLVVALVAALVLLSVRAWNAREDAAPEAGSYGGTGERQEIMDTAEQFVLRVTTFSPKDLDADKRLPKYRERVGELVTTKFRKGFEEAAEIPEQMAAKYQQSRTGTVNNVGIASASEDRATVLVGGEVSEQYGDDKPLPAPIRWKIELRKVKGEWLVDAREPVTGDGQ